MSPVRGLDRPEPLRLDQAALFLDIDGTLAAFEARPQDVEADPDRTNLIADLHRRLGGRLAVISGRSLNDIDRILGGAAPAAAGVHGLERRRADGALFRATPDPALPDVWDTFTKLGRQWPGVLIEDKSLSIAVHFRNAPQAARALSRAALSLAADHGLVLQLGDMVAELRSPGPDKGQALTAFMSEAPFKGHLPVFVGDDATDEVAFVAAQALGGFGVLVGPQRATAASYRLASVAAVLSWLGEAARQGVAA